MKENRLQESGNQGPSIDDTGAIHNQDNEAEPVAVEEWNATEGLVSDEETAVGEDPTTVEEEQIAWENEDE